MTVETAKLLHEQLIEAGCKRIKMVWHGGEPLLRGIDFYREVVAVQVALKNRYQDVQMLNGVQTNATLITPGWCDFFREQHFGVGGSLDGWRELHDIHRRYPDGTGAFDDAFAGIRMAQSKGVSTGFIAVVTKDTLLVDAERLFEFWLSVSNSFEFNPCWEPLTDGKERPAYAVEPGEYLDFCLRLFDLWWKRNDPDIKIRYLRGLVQAILGGKDMTCNFKGNCGDFFSMEADGDIYPCGKFSGMEGFRLGNVHDMPIAAMLQDQTYQDFLAHRTVLSASCQVCEWVHVCHNGCTYERYLGHGQFSERSPFCETHRRALEYVQQKIVECRQAQ